MKRSLLLLLVLLSGDLAAEEIHRSRYNGLDLNRPKVRIKLLKVAQGFREPTDLQFHPQLPDVMFVTEKGGRLKRHEIKTWKQTTLKKLNVLTSSEQGLLGLAFHPKFAENKTIFLNYSVRNKKGKSVTRVSSWTLGKKKITNEKVILEVVQPYSNHNAGQLMFGPDGYLYIGLGDGGSANDPFNHGQNTMTLLGSMLRIDINKQENGKAYAIPKDNPFINKKKHLPEIYGFGLRNPWRYSFNPEGKLIVADVGQFEYEEIAFLNKGENHGWRIKEGFHCFKGDCKTPGLTDPLVEYGRRDGNSITGGYVMTSAHIPELANHYIFGDFGSGRLWASSLKKKNHMIALGVFPFKWSTFGRDLQGRVYAVEFFNGRIFRIEKI